MALRNSSVAGTKAPQAPLAPRILPAYIDVYVGMTVEDTVSGAQRPWIMGVGGAVMRQGELVGHQQRPPVLVHATKLSDNEQIKTQSNSLLTHAPVTQNNRSSFLPVVRFSRRVPEMSVRSLHGFERSIITVRTRRVLSTSVQDCVVQIINKGKTYPVFLPGATWTSFRSSKQTRHKRSYSRKASTAELTGLLL
ncbi:hypothetical protein FHG87_012775 [Trinorchestia longiramus]|nr:hypothetical protein FHG87_012775 [Trinorchestia longiramus]